MTNKQLSNHIGGVEDRLVEQAESVKNYAMERRKRNVGRLLAMAAILVLMVGSFSAGALVFAKEIIVEVPAEQERVTLEEIGLTLLMPYEWNGKYEVIKGTFEENNSVMWEFCAKSVYDAQTPVVDSNDEVYRGTLFYVYQYADYSMSAFDFVKNLDAEQAGNVKYLFATETATYAMRYAKGNQFNPENAEQEAQYRTLEQSIRNLQFIMPGISEMVDDNRQEITEEIYTLISEAQKERYEIKNYELQIYSIEKDRADYNFVADWVPIRSVEDDPLIQGMRQAAALLTDEQEKAWAEEYIHGWVLEMQGWQETERMDTYVTVVMDGEDSWTLYYSYVMDGKESLILFEDYIRENWAEDAEERRQSGIALVNERIEKLRNSDT